MDRAKVVRIMGLFQPSWAKKDKTKALSAVNHLQNQKEIGKAAQESPHPEVRCVAVNKLSDQNLLEKIAKIDRDVGVQTAAIYKLANQAVLEELAKNHHEIKIRLAAVSKIANQETLKTIAAADKDFAVKRKAYERLKNWQSVYQYSDSEKERNEAIRRIEDEEFLKRAALKSNYESVRLQAIRKIRSQDILLSIVMDSRMPGTCRDTAFGMITKPDLLKKIAASDIGGYHNIALNKLNSASLVEEIVMGKLTATDSRRIELVHRIKNQELMLRLALGGLPAGNSARLEAAVIALEKLPPAAVEMAILPMQNNTPQNIKDVLLFYACKHRFSEDVIEKLINSGADVNTMGAGPTKEEPAAWGCLYSYALNVTPLYYVILHNQLDLVDKFLEKGAKTGLCTKTNTYMDDNGFGKYPETTTNQEPFDLIGFALEKGISLKR